MDRVKLSAQKRDILGRKVKTLRRGGVLPANVYGRKADSLAVQIPLKEFMPVFEKVGETGLIDLQVNGEVRPVLVANVQAHPVTDLPLHVDFRQVDLREKITASVPIELTGEVPAENMGVGILVQQLNEIEIEALPTDLPEKLIADVSKLENIDDAIMVKDLVIDEEKITIQAEQNLIVAKIEPPAKEEEVAPPVEEVPTEEAAPAEGEEAQTKEKPTEETERTEKKKEE